MEFSQYVIYVAVGVITGIGITLFIGYLWNYFIIKEFRETNRLIREVIFQIVADRNKDRINRIDDKTEWRN